MGRVGKKADPDCDGLSKILGDKVKKKMNFHVNCCY